MEKNPDSTSVGFSRLPRREGCSVAKEWMGCCGACCGTCKVNGHGCLGCSTGYATGERTLARAKCAVKVCCLGRGFSSCADCADVPTCPTLLAFHSHPGYKYGKYRQAIAFIRAHGYPAFFAVTQKWTGACGRYPPPEPGPHPNPEPPGKDLREGY